MEGRKVLVIGLDSAPPQYIFGSWLDHLPNIKKLIMNGTYGEIQSTIPPITIPAWMSFVTGKNPGRLGLYGFRNRKGFSYEATKIATADTIKEDTLWDLLSRVGKKVCIIGVPPTYPPKPVNGLMVTCFLTPDTTCEYTYPPELKEEIASVVGDYVVDVEEFRTEDKEGLLRRIYEMTEKRFQLIKHLLKNKEWDFFMVVEMGPDRIQHGFWKFFDRSHRKYVPDSPFKNTIPEYYQYLDSQIGELLDLIGEDTVVIIVSDHGAKKMEGCININDWLIEEGYLQLKEEPSGIVRLKEAQVNWEKTKAWGLGGYYGRLFLNVKGREPQGVVDPADYERIRNEIAEKLRALKDDRGHYMNTKVIKPEEVFKGPYVQEAPDLFIYFGDLFWRSTEDIGHDSIYSFDTEVGPDDAVHDEYGVFILYDPRRRGGKRKIGLKMVDGAPTILHLLGLPIPEDMEGKVIR